MVNKIIRQSLERLLANAYAPTPVGEAKHRTDVVLLRTALKDVPPDTARWRWFREHLPLFILHDTLACKFAAPDKAYADEVDETLSKAIAAWRPRDDR